MRTAWKKLETGRPGIGKIEAARTAGAEDARRGTGDPETPEPSRVDRRREHRRRRREERKDPEAVVVFPDEGPEEAGQSHVARRRAQRQARRGGGDVFIEKFAEKMDFSVTNAGDSPREIAERIGERAKQEIVERVTDELVRRNRDDAERLQDTVRADPTPEGSY